MHIQQNIQDSPNGLQVWTVLSLGVVLLCNSGRARGQQEGLQYSRGSSGVVDNRVAQVENIGKIWDRSDEGVTSGLAINSCS